jgi:hypothetical protein
MTENPSRPPIRAYDSNHSIRKGRRLQVWLLLTGMNGCEETAAKRFLFLFYNRFEIRFLFVKWYF